VSGVLLLSLAAAGATIAQQPEQYENPGDLRPAIVLPAELVRYGIQHYRRRSVEGVCERRRAEARADRHP